MSHIIWDIYHCYHFEALYPVKLLLAIIYIKKVTDFSRISISDMSINFLYKTLCNDIKYACFIGNQPISYFYQNFNRN